MEESRIIAVTILTSLIWILVTITTAADTREIERNMLPIIGTKTLMVQRLFLAILLGITITLVTTITWHLILRG
jgi:uncharacterized membrane protein (DUF106 family)